ncbi:MAG: 5-nucleotidase, partial [Candidatus Eremiobacteraeota bacterium]|nr:5-nucleotidase [Candidatus Eremiobacteraeota bacterium]
MRIYHTSDVHDRRHVAAPMSALRAAKPGLYADCGDSLRGSQTMYYRREPIIAELDAARVDVQAMGNREFHYLFGAVCARAAQMKHPLTCANLSDAKGRALPFSTDVVVWRDDGTSAWTLRFFGLLVVQYPTGSWWERVFSWRFADPIAVAQRIADATPPETTLIALSHLGLPHDRLLAQRVPRLELILGGHSHDTLHEPEVVNGVPIVHAGPFAEFASRTELSKDASGRARITDFALEPL